MSIERFKTCTRDTHQPWYGETSKLRVKSKYIDLTYNLLFIWYELYRECEHFRFFENLGDQSQKKRNLSFFWQLRGNNRSKYLNEILYISGQFKVDSPFFYLFHTSLSLLPFSFSHTHVRQNKTRTHTHAKHSDACFICFVLVIVQHLTSHFNIES